MPSKSPAQAKLMRAVAHGWKKPGGGPSRSVAKEFVAADKKAKGYGIGGTITSGIAELKAKQEDPVAFYEQRYGTEPLTLKKLKKLGPGKDSFLGVIPTIQDLVAAGWTPEVVGDTDEDTVWYPSQTTSLGPTGGLGLPPQGGYHIPQAPAPGAEAEPGSIGAEIFEKYGIVDPTATRYDLTSQERMREDPLAHLAPDDPARGEYEGYEAQREAGRQREERMRNIQIYPEHTQERKASPYRQQLKAHKARIADILKPEGKALGGLLTVMQNPEERGKLQRRNFKGMRPVIPQLDKGGNEAEMRAGIDTTPGFQIGGLAQFGGSRMPYRGRGPQRIPQRGRQPMRGRGRPQLNKMMGRRGQMGGARGMPGRGRPNPQMMEMMKRKVQQAGGRGGLGKQVGLGRPGRVQPGGPGGMPGGRGQMLRGRTTSSPSGRGSPRGIPSGISPADARMPGGRAMPYRGLMQRMQQQQRRGGQGNRIGTGDQQGGLARAMQTQTGRPPISRRMAFPGTR